MWNGMGFPTLNQLVLHSSLVRDVTSKARLYFQLLVETLFPNPIRAEKQTCE